MTVSHAKVLHWITYNRTTISLEMPVPSQGHYSFFRNACTKSGSLQFSVYRLLTDFVILLLHLLDFYQVNITKGVEHKIKILQIILDSQ
jgi:hypothetical protein